jgi:hypothetical protein
MEQAERKAKDEAYRKENEYRDNLKAINRDHLNTVNRLNEEMN